ncbi:hypothetical protein [Nostoc sp.]|uniref:hypothetical protein n=1 Tax=Nostoc sp. TaxID=1180 RepID=UPI002FFA25FB
MKKSNLLFQQEIPRFVVFVSLLAFLLKIFQVTLLGYFLGQLFLGLINLLLFICIILSIIYFILRFKIFGLITAIVPIITLIIAFVSLSIDPVKTDFFIYYIPRNLVVAKIQANYQFQPTSTSKRTVTVNSMLVQVKQYRNAFEVYFPRYSWGFGDGGADIVYRSDNQDISITPEQYQQLRDKSTTYAEPYFKKVIKIQDHWFWQEDEW